jgi:hypothetical protein
MVTTVADASTTIHWVDATPPSDTQPYPNPGLLERAAAATGNPVIVNDVEFEVPTFGPLIHTKHVDSDMRKRIKNPVGFAENPVKPGVSENQCGNAPGDDSLEM